MSIYISEIFGPTIQGEGQLIGKPTVFVRVGGCDYRCQWCDSLYAVKPQYRSTWQKMDEPTIMQAVKQLTDDTPILITLSGGNPAMYDLSQLLALGQPQGFTFAMETQGSLVKPYFADLDYLTVSPKPPSARVRFEPMKLQRVLDAHPTPSLKIVVADESDYRFARRIYHQYPTVPMTLQPCNLTTETQDSADIQALNNRLQWLIDKAHADGWYQVRILPQLHVLIWNNKRGV